MPSHLSLVRDGRSVSTERQLSGWRGTLEDLEAMRAMCRRELGLDNPATFNHALYEIAGKIITGWNARTEWERLNACFEFVTQNVIWTPDPAGGNVRLLSALDTLNQRAADCDELVDLLAPLLGMVGFKRLSFRALLLDETPDGSFDHVELAVGVSSGISPSGIYLVDPSAQNQPIGWYVENPLKEIYYDIYDEADAENLSGIVDSVAKIGTTVFGFFSHHSSQTPQQITEGAQFDVAAKELVTLFDSIEHKAPATITIDDYNNAAAKYNALASAVAQAGSIKYITDHWNSPAYNATFQTRLAQIQNAALANSVTTTATTTGTTATAGGGASSYLPLILAAGAAFVAGKVLSN